MSNLGEKERGEFRKFVGAAYTYLIYCRHDASVFILIFRSDGSNIRPENFEFWKTRSYKPNTIKNDFESRNYVEVSIDIEL